MAILCSFSKPSKESELPRVFSLADESSKISVRSFYLSLLKVSSIIDIDILLTSKIIQFHLEHYISTLSCCYIEQILNKLGHQLASFLYFYLCQDYEYGSVCRSNEKKMKWIKIVKRDFHECVYTKI